MLVIISVFIVKNTFPMEVSLQFPVRLSVFSWSSVWKLVLNESCWFSLGPHSSAVSGHSTALASCRAVAALLFVEVYLSLHMNGSALGPLEACSSPKEHGCFSSNSPSSTCPLHGDHRYVTKKLPSFDLCVCFISFLTTYLSSKCICCPKGIALLN